MSDELSPAKVRLTDGLGPFPEPRLWYDPETQRCSSMAPLRPTYEPMWDEGDMRAAVAAERERCAKIADEHARRNYPWGSENTDRYHAQADWAERIAAAIRRA